MPRDIQLHDFGTAAYDITVRKGLREGRRQRAAVTGDPESVILTANRTSGIGPAGFIIGATTTGFSVDRPFHELRYKWSFGDPGNYLRLAANMPWGTDHNVAYGPWAAHTFAPTPVDFLAAGSDTITYTVTCEVTDGTITRTGSIDITVTNPDVAFAGLGTLIVDPSGDFSLGLSEHPGAQTFTTLAAAHAAVGGSDLARVVLRKNNNYPISPPNWNCEHIQITSFGDAGESLPILNEGIEVYHGHSGDAEFYDLEIDRGYDPTVPTLKDATGKGVYIRGKAKTGRHTTIHNLGIRGCDLSVTFEGQRFNNVVSGCHITDWYDFGVFQGNAGWTALVGNTIAQNPLTRMGGGKYNSDYANHGPMRFSRVLDGAPMVVNNCDLASFNNWGYSGSKYTTQPPIRMNNGGDPNLPKLVMTQIRTVGHQLGLPATNDYSASFPVEALYDKIYHVRWSETGKHLGASFGGVRFSNVVTIDVDTNWAIGSLFNAGPGGYTDTGDYATRYPVYLGYPDTDNEIKHFQEYLGITVIKLATAGNADPATQPINIVNIESNSLYPAAPKSRNPDSILTGGILIHAPLWGVTAPVKTDDPLASLASQPLGAHREQDPIDIAYAVPLSVLASYAPTVNIPADAGDVMPLDDFFGTLRNLSAPTTGAIEYG